MKENNERYLLKLLKNGSYEAYTELYNKWLPFLFRFVFSFVKSRFVTEEIVQNTFVKVWVNRNKIKEDKSFKAYLFTISYHMILREFRNQLSQTPMEDYVVFANDITHSESLDIYKMDFDFFLSELEKAKSFLSLRQREIFEMNKEENLSIKEIAEKLEINEQTVRNQLSISLKIIKSKLAGFPILVFLYLDYTRIW